MTEPALIDHLGRACYRVTLHATAWPQGHVPPSWEELKPGERDLHRAYARATLLAAGAPEWLSKVIEALRP